MVFLLLVPVVLGARLPTIGGDNNNWGIILNAYLNVSHDSSGKLKQGLNMSVYDLNVTNNLNVYSINGTPLGSFDNNSGDDLKNGSDIYSTNFNATNITSTNITSNQLSLGECTSGEDTYIYFNDDSCGDEYIKWDDSSDIFEISDSLDVDNGITTTTVIASSDIMTTGSGDDLWLGTSTQADANFRAYASGDLNISGTMNSSEVYANNIYQNGNKVNDSLYDLNQFAGFSTLSSDENISLQIARNMTDIERNLNNTDNSSLYAKKGTTLTDTKICTWSDASDGIECDYTDVSGGGDTNDLAIFNVSMADNDTIVRTHNDTWVQTIVNQFTNFIDDLWEEENSTTLFDQYIPHFYELENFTANIDGYIPHFWELENETYSTEADLTTELDDQYCSIESQWNWADNASSINESVTASLSERVNSSSQFGGEISGTYGAIILSNTALDDQYIRVGTVDISKNVSNYTEYLRSDALNNTDVDFRNVNITSNTTIQENNTIKWLNGSQNLGMDEYWNGSCKIIRNYVSGNNITWC